MRFHQNLYRALRKAEGFLACPQILYRSLQGIGWVQNGEAAHINRTAVVDVALSIIALETDGTLEGCGIYQRAVFIKRLNTGLFRFTPLLTGGRQAAMFIL